MTKDELRLAAALDTSSRAAKRLRSSMENDRPLLARAIVAQDDRDLDLARVLDAFVQRFQQMHEHMTHRLFPAMYRTQQLGDRPPPMLALLKWLDEQKIIDSARVWVERAEVRNRLIHEYPLEVDDRLAALQAAVQHADAMLAEFDRVSARIAPRNLGDDI